MDTFESFSRIHLLVAVTFVTTCVVAVFLARRASDANRVRVEHVFGWISVAIFVAVNHQLWLRTDRFDARTSLPLHVCDLALLAVPLVLIRNWRPARVVLYYFGLLLSSQGLFTPDLDEGPAHWPFWGFWLLHFAVIGTAIYDLAARGFRPRWPDLALAIGIGIAYVGAMVTIDVLFTCNYGYVGPIKPAKPTIIDALGHWPLRVFIMSGLAVLLMTLATLPWTAARRRRRSSGIPLDAQAS